MAKKPKNYRPQQRQRSKDTLDVSTESRFEGPSSPEATMSKLAEMFEVETVAKGDTPDTYLGSILASIANGIAFASEHTLTEDDMVALIPDLVIVAREAAEKLQAQGFDRIHDHSAISRPDFQRLMLAEWETYARYKGISPDAFDLTTSSINLPDEEIERLQHEDAYDPQYNAYSTLLYIYSASKGMSKLTQSRTINLGNLEDIRQRSFHNIERSLRQNQTTVRRETTKSLEYLFSDDVTNFLEYFGDQNTHVFLDTVPTENFPAQELDFTVLPTGTGLEDIVAGIVGRLSEREKAYVDLNRVAVLNAIREHVGKDRCYFAHGKKSGKQMLDQESDTLIDEDYVVLIIQGLDDNGATQTEHALAISPIAQKHAAYLTRNDASAGTWREILSLPKQDARYFGARDLRFTGSTGRTPYAMMEEKIKALLECHPDDFHEKLRMRSDGTYRLENTQREVGKSALAFNLSF